MRNDNLMTRHVVRGIRFIVLAVVTSGAGGIASADDVGGCDGIDGIVPYCGFIHPEDLEVLGGGDRMIVSEYGSLDGSKAGALAVFSLRDATHVRVFPAATARSEKRAGWGDPACPGPPSDAFDPHGIFHGKIAGDTRLLVVNHGGRESVELFEIERDAGGDVALIWRGCVIAPQGAWLNDVAGLPDGEFVVTHMMTRASTSEAIYAAEASKAATGYVLAWSESGGWNEVQGTAGALPNGIEVSDDGSRLFVNYYFGDEVVAFDRSSGQRLWRASVNGPDNSSWAADGRLLVASHEADLEDVMHCSEHGGDFCPLAYAVVAIDRDTGAHETLMTGGGAPFGGATVAVEVDGHYYLGSFAGDRIVRR